MAGLSKPILDHLSSTWKSKRKPVWYTKNAPTADQRGGTPLAHTSLGPHGKSSSAHASLSSPSCAALGMHAEMHVQVKIPIGRGRANHLSWMP